MKLLFGFLLFASAWTSTLAGKPSGSPGGSPSTSYAQKDAACTLYYHTVGMYYKPETAKKNEHLICDPADQGGGTYLACVLLENDNGDDGDDPDDKGNIVPFTGKCEISKCSGLADAEDIDTKSLPAGESQATERVTICHRTCSETNPWVRITIDNDAWQKGDETCGDANGHQPNLGGDGSTGNKGHKVSDCNFDQGKDISAWGSNTGDYLIKWHGTRQNVANEIAATNPNVTFTGGYKSEKEYWKYWERACPHVRAMKEKKSCCMKVVNGKNDYSECCGGPYTESGTDKPTDAPSIGPTDIPTGKPTKAPVTSTPTGACPTVPTSGSDKFTKTLYITFNGISGVEDHKSDTVQEFMETGNNTMTIAAFQGAIKDIYNGMTSDGICEQYTRLVDTVTIDDKSSVSAMNTDHDMVARRITATVKGWCTDCQDLPFLPADECAAEDISYCPQCIDLNGGTEPGKIVTISGAKLAAALNEHFQLTDTIAEIIRMQGEILGETTCGNGYQYILSNGNTKCIG